MTYPIILSTPGVRTFAEAVDDERCRQLVRWGEQHHPDGTGITGDIERANLARHTCSTMFRLGQGTWRDILWEEIAEALAETSSDRLKKELIQCAAVIQAWLWDIESRQGS